MKKELKYIFLVIILFGLGEGFFYNFLELWMEQNGLSIETISTIFSLCSLIAVLFIFIFSNLIRKHTIKKFVSMLLLSKSVILLLLFILNGTGLKWFIKFFILLERAIDTEITVSLYPMMSLIKMDNKTYGRKDIVYNFVYYLSLLLSGIWLGKSFIFGTITYNTYAIFSAVLIFISFIVLSRIKIKVKPEKEENPSEIIVFTLLKKIVKDKPSNYYFGFLLFSEISYYALMGLSMKFLTGVFGYDQTAASNIRVLLGIGAAAFAMIALKYFTFKNDYVNISIKYVTRIIFLVIALIVMNNSWYFIAFAVPRFLSTSYTHVTCAPYINRYAGKYQLAFCNLREMIVYFGNFIGYWLCGVCFAHGIWYNYLLTLIFLVVMLVFGYVAIYYRKKEENDRKQVG